MIRLILQREEPTAVETMGRLELGDNITSAASSTVLHTVEQEWRPTAPGGEPFNSCVPAGRYDLIKHVRPNGQKVVALVNPGLGVYYEEKDRPFSVGRYLILMHPGNTHVDIVGCIAPGLGRSGQMVTSSRHAMEKIMAYIGGDEAELLIKDADPSPPVMNE